MYAFSQQLRRSAAAVTHVNKDVVLSTEPTHVIVGLAMCRMLATAASVMVRSVQKQQYVNRSVTEHTHACFLSFLSLSLTHFLSVPCTCTHTHTHAHTHTHTHTHTEE